MARFTEREAGTYRCRFVKLDEGYTITDRETKEEVVRWRWIFQEVGNDLTTGQIDTLTSPGFAKGSNGLRFLTGMLGRPPTKEDDTDNLIGQEFDVQYGPNRAGTLAIIGVLRVAQGVSPTSVLGVGNIPTMDLTPPGELPF